MAAIAFKPRTTLYAGENALALGRAAALSYQSSAEVQATATGWGFPAVRFVSAGETQAFVMANDEAVVVAFRGTEPTKLKDWMSDARVVLVPGPAGRVHRGFSDALDQAWTPVRAAIDALQTKAQSLWVTGHSLGAGLATLAVARLRLDEDKPVYGLYTFGQPRTGDREFERTFNADFKSQTFRFVNNNDVVTRVPPRSFQYSHVGTFLYFDAHGVLQTDLGFWLRLLDSVQGRIDDFLKPGTDGLKDHAMTRYLERLERNVSVQPSLTSA